MSTSCCVRVLADGGPTLCVSAWLWLDGRVFKITQGYTLSVDDCGRAALAIFGNIFAVIFLMCVFHQLVGN